MGHYCPTNVKGMGMHTKRETMIYTNGIDYDGDNFYDYEDRNREEPQRFNRTVPAGVRLGPRTKLLLEEARSDWYDRQYLDRFVNWVIPTNRSNTHKSMELAVA